MTETRTNRFELPQWGSGSDAGSREDFNEAFDRLNDRAAYDDGATLGVLPATDVAGRYALVSLAGDYRTVYRSHGAGWDAVGGNTMPRAFHHRALDGQARTDTAVTFSHPDAANPGATIGYDGSALLSGTVRVYDDDEQTRGVLMIGTDVAADPATRGRLHVRTRIDGEHALVIQPHGAAAGNLLAVRNAGGANVLTVDALGRLQQRTHAAFGGATMPTASVLSVAPTSSDSDGITNGLLLYGQSAAATKTILRVHRDTADAAPIAQIDRDGITVGRLPWTGAMATGGVTVSANNMVMRASGTIGNPYYLHIRRSDPTSAATEADPTKDTALVSIGETGISTSLPVYVSNRNRLTGATMALYRVTDFAAPYLDLARLVPGVGGVETAQHAASWLSDGRLSTGAWWKSTGTLRDARQSIRHLCTKIWASPGDGPTVGIAVPQNSTYTYTFPAMTARSGTTTDINIGVLVELMLGANTITPNNSDGQVYAVRTFVSVNGGAFTLLAEQENAQATPTPDRRPTGDVLTFTHRRESIPPGGTFQVRLQFTTGGAVPTVYLRKMDLNVEEALFEIYTAA